MYKENLGFFSVRFVVGVALILAHKLIKPSEDLIVPFQAEGR